MSELPLAPGNWPAKTTTDESGVIGLVVTSLALLPNRVAGLIPIFPTEYPSVTKRRCVRPGDIGISLSLRHG